MSDLAKLLWGLNCLCASPESRLPSKVYFLTPQILSIPYPTSDHQVQIHQFLENY